MARGQNQKPLSEQYSPKLIRLMNFLHDTEYPQNHTFSEDVLLEITPSDITRFFKILAYGTETPVARDYPIYSRSSNLAQYKKAISFFMPNKLMQWNVATKSGNPTRSIPVNQVILDVKKAEVRKLGRPSKVKRDLKKHEFKKSLRLLEAFGDFERKIKVTTMKKLQFNLIGRTDDICNIETKDLRGHDRYPNMCLQTKVSWSKNVLEERTCPDQIIIGAMDTDFCVLLALSCYLESKFTINIGHPRFLFGERPDEEEPDRMNGRYQMLLRSLWNNDEFQEILRDVRGSLGTHSLRKFPATWAAENGCTLYECEIRGRWKGKRNGQTVNIYISVEQAPTDAKVAGVLAVGGPIMYKVKEGSGVTRQFILEHVVPGIANYFRDDASNNIAEVLGNALLWACHEDSLSHMMDPAVRRRVKDAYAAIRPEEHAEEYNPVQKVPLHVYRVENRFFIDELIAETTPNAQNVAQNQQQTANIQQSMTSVLVQLVHLRQNMAEDNRRHTESINNLRNYCSQEFVAIKTQNRRIAMIPFARVRQQQQEGNNNDNNNGPPNVNVADFNPNATLSPHPRSLHQLWAEYMFGIGGRKPAKDFTTAERGRCKYKYCRRKIVWDCISRLIRSGYTDDVAIDRIYQCYGANRSVSNIIEAMKRDRRDGGHPNLRT